MDRPCAVCGDMGNEEYMKFINGVWVCSSQCAGSIYTTKNITLNAEGILSVPPEGSFKVTNFYVNAYGKFVVEYDDGGT